MGLAPVAELICLLRYIDNAISDTKAGPEIEILTLKDAIRKVYILDPGKQACLLVTL